MAERVYIVTDRGRNTLSSRRYTEYQATAIRKGDRPDWGRVGTEPDEPVMLSIYEDEITGILTTNIFAFEVYMAGHE